MIRPPHTKVVINGCFDVLHEGHKHLIKYAFGLSCHGSLLILVNSDKSVRELKGTQRPVVPEYQRVQDIMDYKLELNRQYFEYPVTTVVLFDTEEELEELINDFEPDVIIKGNDRPDVRTIVGSDRWPILILPRIKDENGGEISSTRKIEDAQKES